MKKTIIIFSICALILLILALFIYQETRPKVIKNDYYTLEPEPWIEYKSYDSDPTNIKIDISKATRGKSNFDINKQELYDGGLKTIFLFGVYNGTMFDTIYYEINNPEMIKMRLDPEMDPDDGIIEGFILGKREEGKFIFFIFVDEDWRKALRFTNILWSTDLGKGADIRGFNFSKKEKGIYIEKVTFDSDWFESSSGTGGIFIGEITKEMQENKNVLGATMMYAR